MPDKKYEVKDAKVTEVSLVPAGANGEEFAMFKSYEEEKGGKQINLKKRSVTPQEFAEFVASQIEGADTADILDSFNEFGNMDSIDQRELASLVADSYDMTTGDVLEILDEFAMRKIDDNSKGGSDEPMDFDELVEKINDLDEDKKDELAKELGIEVEKSEEEVEEQEVEKDLDELPNWAKEEIEKREKTEEELQKLREERELEKMADRVEKNFGYLPGDTVENAEILKSVKDSVSEDQFEKLENKLDALAEQIDLEKTFEEAGAKDPAEAGNAFEKATQLAEEKMEKGDYASMADARAEVWKENQELRKQYEKQRNQ